jgi:hypothetical protein
MQRTITIAISKVGICSIYSICETLGYGKLQSNKNSIGLNSADGTDLASIFQVAKPLAGGLSACRPWFATW